MVPEKKLANKINFDHSREKHKKVFAKIINFEHGPYQ